MPILTQKNLAHTPRPPKGLRVLSLLFGLSLIPGCSPSNSATGSDRPQDESEGDTQNTDAGKDAPDKGSKSGPSSGSKGNSTKPENDPGDNGGGEDEAEGPKFDLAIPDVSTDPKDGPGGGPDCEDIKHKPCDENSDDLLHAIGINCPGEIPEINASFRGAEKSRGLRSSLGTTKAFAPREGKKYLVLGTGNVSELSNKTPAKDSNFSPRYCNSILSNKHNFSHELPKPIKTNKVGDVDCIDNPALIGTGDCSNTIEAQWNAAQSPKHRVKDYSELRLKVTVPSWAKSLSFDFAFGTVEYPEFYGKMYNDIFIAWLESKTWTGNISFDKKGNPISLNAGFLDFRDAQRGTRNDPECLKGCVAPELHGSCLEQHAATKWLTTKIGVTPGDEIELIFAIMDLGDGILDSHVLIDNFHWGCEQQDKPETDPPK